MPKSCYFFDKSKITLYTRSTPKKLTKILINNLYGEDKFFIKKGELIGNPVTVDISTNSKTGLGLLGERELLGQRGIHYPPPPVD